MKPVICFGEALIDFLNSAENPEGLINIKQYRQYPGGAPANAAVAVARLGGKSFFAGQVGEDSFGDFLASSIAAYGVDTRFLTRHPEAATALAFVMLDHTGDRSFTFYRNKTADVLFTPEQVNDSWFDNQPLFHFCSNTLTDGDIANTTLAAVDKAASFDSLISFDVNLRHNLWSTGEADIALVNQLVFKSDLIKFSREEFDYLCEGTPEAYIQRCFSENVKLIVITAGENQIEFITSASRHYLAAPNVKAIDTTAGGDAFIGALLYALSQFDTPKAHLGNVDELAKLINFAAHCGSHAVARPGAFPALPCLKDVEAHWPVELYK